MSEYDLKLLPREDSFDFLAKTLTNGPFGKYAQKLWSWPPAHQTSSA